MPQNDMAGSTTYKQEEVIERHLKVLESFDNTQFNDLKQGRIDIKELFAADASELIDALLTHDQDETEAEGTDDARDESAKRMPGPATSNQLQLIRKLMDEKQLVKDGIIDAEHLYARFNASTASKFIDAVKFIPRPEAPQ